MNFFKIVGEVLSKSCVEGFPEKGLKFLDNKPSQDDEYFEFHEKLVEFIRNLIPTEVDIKVRQHIIDMIKERICNALSNKFRPDQNIIVLPSGSCLNGTFLPGADIDITIFTYPYRYDIKETMCYLQEHLKDLAYDGFKPIPQATVPVLKFRIYPGISIDISFEILNGPLNIFAVRKIFDDIPSILPAQLFFKTILHKKHLDVPFIGGISSYTLQLMLVAYIQYSGEPKNITELILGFCDFYGNKFNYILTGIDVRNGGRLFSRVKENKLTSRTPWVLYIQDPFDEKNVLGINAFKMNIIKYELSEIYRQITSGEGDILLNSLYSELNENLYIQNNIKTYAKHYRL